MKHFPPRSRPYWPVALFTAVFTLGGALVPGLLGDEQQRLKIGLQADGRIVVPTNQVLEPAGKQVVFPGRPVDLALIDEGRTLVVKNLRDLVFVDAATGAVRQTLASRVGFSVVGLLAHGGKVFATDVRSHVRIAARGEDGRYRWGDAFELDD